ncbi:hypothetical protein FACS189452_04120 [Bacteroidia bacterium]|nr:hypothetical protein FACS189452_04120 [Bacteroidia bacterium]
MKTLYYSTVILKWQNKSNKKVYFSLLFTIFANEIYKVVKLDKYPKKNIIFAVKLVFHNLLNIQYVTAYSNLIFVGIIFFIDAVILGAYCQKYFCAAISIGNASNYYDNGEFDDYFFVQTPSRANTVLHCEWLVFIDLSGHCDICCGARG